MDMKNKAKYKKIYSNDKIAGTFTQKTASIVTDIFKSMQNDVLVKTKAFK